MCTSIIAYDEIPADFPHKIDEYQNEYENYTNELNHKNNSSAHDVSSGESSEYEYLKAQSLKENSPSIHSMTDEKLIYSSVRFSFIFTMNLYICN